MNTIRTALLVSVFCVSACGAPDPTAPHATLAPAFARNDGHGQVVGMTVAPSDLSLTVGQAATLTATYTDRKGNPFAAANAPVTYWGCAPQETCFGVVRLLPSNGGGSVQVTGLASGSVTVWASDGLGHWANVAVTVTP
jgi:uncharacterized protein YjdB